MSLRCLLLSLVLFGLSTPLSAQEVGTCEPGEAEAWLEGRNVRARVRTTGKLFRRSDRSSGYEVPKGSGVSPLHMINLWVSGFVADTVRTAGATYAYDAFWPGPLDAVGRPPDDCSAYDTVYRITRDELVLFENTGTLTGGLRTWPAHLGAPVLDGDGDPTNYDVEAGDRPALHGDETLWWVMNDLGNNQVTFPQNDIGPGLEVQGLAYAFNQPGTLGQATLYKYRIHYRGTTPLDSAYIGLFVDPDLGFFDDDFVGVDTTLGLGFAYNEDNDDQLYGTAPPAVGATYLQTPSGIEDPTPLGLTAFVVHFIDGGVMGPPENAGDYYSYLRARWKDGQPITKGRFGRDFSTTPTRFMYPGDPVTVSPWSQIHDFHSDPDLGIVRTDRVFLMATGPFRMQPGQVHEISFAVVWARGGDHLDSITELREATRLIQDQADHLLAPSIEAPVAPTEFAFGVSRAAPNPFTDRTTIRYTLPQEMQVRLEVFDLLGRRVATLVDATQPAASYAVPFEAGPLPPGVYLYRIQMDHHTATGTMVRQ